MRWADQPDVAALIAPSPLLIEAGLRDAGHPIESSREAHLTLERVYRLLNAADHLKRCEFDDGHRWGGDVAYDFMDHYLKE